MHQIDLMNNSMRKLKETKIEFNHLIYVFENLFDAQLDKNFMGSLMIAKSWLICQIL